MIRLTVRETATLLGKDKHWVYNVLRKLGHMSVRGFLEINQVSELLWYSIQTKGFESYTYSILVDRQFHTLVANNNAEGLKEALEKFGNFTEGTFAELVIAYKDVYKQPVSSIILNLSRKLDVEKLKDGVKAYIQKKYLIHLLQKENLKSILNLSKIKISDEDRNGLLLILQSKLKELGLTE